jgi:hypothetical protein
VLRILVAVANRKVLKIETNITFNRPKELKTADNLVKKEQFPMFLQQVQEMGGRIISI